MHRHNEVIVTVDSLGDMGSVTASSVPSSKDVIHLLPHRLVIVPGCQTPSSKRTSTLRPDSEVAPVYKWGVSRGAGTKLCETCFTLLFVN